jgi:hypothetical protein
MGNRHAIEESSMYETWEDMLNRGQVLAESWGNMPANRLRHWGKEGSINFMEGIEDPYRRALVATLLENAKRYYDRLDEATRTLQVGTYEKYVFPIIRMVFANLVAADLVSVQPLPAPTGLVFYMDAVAGRTKGTLTKGTKIYDAQAGPERSYHYTDEVVENEALGVTSTDKIKGTLSYYPVRPGTVDITDGTYHITDDGNGNLIGNVGTPDATYTNTVNYATGVYAVVFTAGHSDSDAVTATYEYDMEASDLIPELEIQLTSSPVVTRPNKLRFRWSLEAEQDLLAVHGIVAETELVTLATNRISQEINEKIIRHLRAIAYNAASPVTFDPTPPVGVSYKDHKEILIDAFTETSNTIFQQTQRMQGSWLVVGMNVANIVETLVPAFVKSPPVSGVAGIRKVGTLGDWEVYKDSAYPTNEWLMGGKGGNFLDTGYVHAVYQGLISTPTITLDDFVSRRGLLTRSAQKVINNRFYAVGTLV